MSTGFAFDVKSPPGYNSDPKVKLDHEASTWKKWQHFSRDLKEDYPDESKVSWYIVMQSVTNHDEYSHHIHLSQDKSDVPRLRIGCMIQHPIPTQAIGIMQDLSERAARHFDVETLLYRAPEHILSKETLDALVQTIKNKCDGSNKRAEKIDMENEQSLREMDSALIIMALVVLSVFAYKWYLEEGLDHRDRAVMNMLWMTAITVSAVYGYYTVFRRIFAKKRWAKEGD